MSSFICSTNVNNNSGGGSVRSSYASDALILQGAKQTNDSFGGLKAADSFNVALKAEYGSLFEETSETKEAQMQVKVEDVSDCMRDVFIEPKAETIDIFENKIKEEILEPIERPLLMNADVLVNSVKQEPHDISDIVDKENEPSAKRAKLYEYDPNSFARNLTVRELVRLEFSEQAPKFVFTGVPFVDIRNLHSFEYAHLLKRKSSKNDEIQRDREERTKRRKKSSRKSKKSKELSDIKKEPMDWEMTPEEEIIKANKQWSKNNYRVIENLDSDTSNDAHQNVQQQSRSVSEIRSNTSSPVYLGPALNKDRYQRSAAKDKFLPLPSEDQDDDIEDPDDLQIEDEDQRGSADDPSDEDYNPEDDGYTSNRWSPALSELNENMIHIEDNSNSGSEQIDIKEELTEEEIQYEDVKTIEIGEYKVETFGEYSKCPRCEKFIKSTFIIRHIKSHDKPPAYLKCPHENCTASFTRANNMYRHNKIVHDDPTPYVCCYKSCDQMKFEHTKDLREHIRTVHKQNVEREIEELENNKFQCTYPGCDKVYGKRQHLKEHMRKHTGDKKYACDVCGERFYVHGHMKRHLYSHTGIKPHACRWKCGAIFASYGGRMKHERAQHSENPYKLECDICGRPFRFDRELDKHKMTHLAPSERVAYRCSYCGIIFDSIPHRERHEKRHQDKDDFHCVECNKYFKNEKNLRHHNKAHHETKQDNSNKHQNKQKKEKKEPPKYKCHMCTIDIMFPLTALRRHLARKHSTNFKCDKEGCNRTFAQQYQFDAHMKLHAHRHCDLCGKDFKRKQNADIHLMGVHGFTKEDLQAQGR